MKCPKNAKKTNEMINNSATTQKPISNSCELGGVLLNGKHICGVGSTMQRDIQVLPTVSQKREGELKTPASDGHGVFRQYAKAH